MLSRKGNSCKLRLLLGPPQLKLLLMQSQPPLRKAQQAKLFKRRGNIRKGRTGAMSGRLVLFFHLLDAILRIAASPDQILFCIIQFILVQFELGFGQVQLVAQCFLFVAGSLRFFFRELRHQSLVFFQQLLRLLQSSHGFFCLGTQLRWILRGIAQGCGKGEVHFIVRETQGFLRQRTLLGSGCQLRELLGCFDSRLVDLDLLDRDRLFSNRRRNLGRLGRSNEAIDRRAQKQHDGDREEFLNRSHEWRVGFPILMR